jgi:hypothetical protein
MPVPSEQSAATCANCGAALVADQRYCLTCGQPCSPVRLAFLDVLSENAGRAGGQAPPSWNVPSTIEMGAGGFLAPVQEQGPAGWLRRNSGLMGLLTVLLMCLLVGLLVGHWAGQDRTPAQQVYKIEGLGGLGAVANGSGSTSGTSTTPESTPATGKSSAAKEAAEGEKETAKEKAPPPKPKKIGAKLKKLSKTTGKKHQEEINALGAQPIETG